MADKYEALRLQNQLCFPLYACGKGIVKRYKPFLDELGLTYTQYITMMVLWEHEQINVKDLGGYLYLDSGTLTPVLKKLENMGYITRKRDTEDERVLIVSLTKEGKELQDKALPVPFQIGSCIHLEPDEAETLYKLLYKLLGELEEE